MSRYWNIRKILGVEPKINTCVGDAKSKQRRCCNPLGLQYRERAEGLIYRIDRQREVSADDFKKLAEALLCQCQHNCESKPWLNQVDEVCEAWINKFEYHKERRKRKQSVRLDSRHIKSISNSPSVVPAPDTKTKIDAPLSNNPIEVEVKRTGISVIPKHTPLSRQSKADDPFTNDKNSIPRTPTTFEDSLRRISEVMNVEGNRLVSEEPFNPPEGNGAGLEKSKDSNLLFQSSDFPSSPIAPLKPKSCNQITNISESTKLREREDMSQTVQDQAAISIKIGSNAPLSNAANGIKSEFKLNTEESIPLDAFDFGNVKCIGAVVPNSKPTQNSKIKPVATKLTNFAADFGKPETSIMPSVLEPPAEANFSRAKAEGCSDGGETLYSEKPKPWHEFLSKPSDPPPSSNILRQDLSSGSNPSISEEPIPSTEASGIILNDPSRESVSAVSTLKEPVPETAITISSQESVPPSTPPTEPDVLPLPSTNAPSQKPPPILVLSSTPETPSPVKSSDLLVQKPLPSFNLGFIPRSPNLRPRAKVSPFLRAKSPVRPVSSGSEFVFGSGYKVPPKSFDFDTWSKLSYAARLPDKITIQEGQSTSPGRKSDRKIGFVEADKPNGDRLCKDVEVSHNESPHNALTKSTHLTLAENPSADNEASESIPGSLETPTKTSQTIEHGLLTPEATPEPVSLSKESILTQDDTANTETTHKSSEEEQAPMREDTYDAPKPAPQLALELSLESQSAYIASTKESFGHAIIRSPARRYKTRPSTKQECTLLTPPASPEESHSVPHLETSRAETPQGRPSTTIHRKPVPSPQPVDTLQQIANACEMCGQSLDGEERCNCEHEERIEWENKQAGFRSRGLRRKLKRRAAIAVSRFKTTGTKMADSVLARLEVED